MRDELNSRDRERLALLEQKVELLLCLHAGVTPYAETKALLSDEQWRRYEQVIDLANGYFGNSFIATGEGEFSALPKSRALSYPEPSRVPDRPDLQSSQSSEPVQ